MKSKEEFKIERDDAQAVTCAEQALADGATKSDISAWFDTWVELYGKDIAVLATKYFHEIA